MNQENIGKFIALKRKQKALTQEQLAEKIGVSNKSISKWENGKCMPDYSVLESLCSELDISISEFMNGGEENIGEKRYAEPQKPIKIFYGGIFVLINLALCIFFCFEHLIFPFEQTVGKVIGIWIFFICSITLYPILKLSVQSDDYSLIAGFNTEKNLDKSLASKMLILISIWNCFTAMIYSFLYLIMPFIEGSAAQSLYGGILITAYITGLAVLILIVNRKYKNSAKEKAVASTDNTKV